MKVACIVAAAGKGKRLKKGEDKAFVLLGGKPIITHTLKVLENCAFIDCIVISVSRDKLKSCRSLVKKYRFRKVTDVVRGGKWRFDSVRNALKRVKDADLVLVHDGARPFAEKGLIKRVFTAARKYGAAVSVTPSKQTLKRVNKNSFVIKTPDRRLFWEAQTPQAFKKGLIEKAYERAKDRRATDDSVLVEKLGYKVRAVKGSCRNIKITTPEDLRLAELFLCA